MDDTAPKARARYWELLRERTPLERLRTAAALTTGVRRLAEAGIRSRDPHASEAEVRHRLIELLYGKSVAERLARPHR